MSKYSYKVDGIERTPLNSGEFSIDENLFTDGGAWFLRKELSSTIRFGGADYKYFKAQTELCRFFTFEIRKRFKVTNEVIYIGRFSLLNCSFNDDLCQVTVKVETLDQYTCLLQNWDKELNVAQITDTSTIWEVENKKLIQFGIGYGTTASPPTTVFSIDGSNDPLDYGDVVEEFVTPYQNVTPGGGNPNIDMMVYCRELIYTACVDGVPQEPNGTGWVLDTACSISSGVYGYSLWWRRYDYTAFLTFDIFTSPPILYYSYGVTQDVPGTPIVDHGLIGIYDGTLTGPNLTPPNQEIWFDLAVLRDFKQTLRSKYVKGGRTLIDVTNRLLENACGGGYSVSSQFFTATLNPVTGTTNICKDLQLWTKSDVANAQLTESDAQNNLQASDKRLTVREEFEDLQIHFNTEWYIDPNNPKTVILEHVSDTRPQTVDLDLTVIDSGIQLKNKNSYNYTGESVPVQERWRFITASLPDFTGQPIDYNGCGNEIIDYNTSQIDTELDVLIGDSEQRALDGFILVQPDSIRSGDSLAQDGIFWAFFAPNMPLSISNLHALFWPYQRKLSRGKLNNVNQTFVSYQKLLQLNDIVFDLCNPNSFDRRKLVRTQYGDCEILKTSYNLARETMTLSLKFNL